MATVVRGFPDTRARDLGRAVAGYLGRRKDRRLDELQQELMGEISNAKDEASATALLGDPKFQSVVTDTERFAVIMNYLNTVPLGTQSITGYDRETGNQRVVSFSEQERPEDVLARENLSLERSRLFYAVDQENDFDFGTSLGRFSSPSEAGNALEEGSGATIMDQEEMARHIQAKGAEIASKQRQMGIDLAKDEFEFRQGQPLTPFDRLISAFETGNMSPRQFNQAWARLTHLGFGKSPDDVAAETKKGLQERGAILAAMSEQGLDFIHMIEENPTLLSSTGAIPRGLANISAELQAAAQLSGLTKRELSHYDFKGFAAQSTAFKNLLLDFAVTYAATQGQTNRSLSDKDFDRFLQIVGSDIRNPNAFIANMDALMRKSQKAFNIMHRRLQGFEYEDAFGAFARFEADPNERRRKERESLLENYPGLIFGGGETGTTLEGNR